MHPRLFDIDIFGRQLTVSTYGTLVAFGIMLGIYLGYRQARRVGLPTDDFLDLCFFGLIAALLGSRLLFVLTNWDRFRGDPWRSFAIWEGGLVFYGGVLSACAVGLYFMWRRKLPFLGSGDVIAPVLSLGHAFGRLGCHFAGCCWGKACPSPPGVRFPRESVAYENMAASGKLDPNLAQATPPLHPVQLYEAGGELLIFAVLVWLGRRKRFDGQVFFVYLLLYGVLRLVTELFRGDAERRFLVELSLPGLGRLLGLGPAEPIFFSTSQFLSLVIIGGAAAALILLGRRARRAGPGTGEPGPGQGPSPAPAEGVASTDPGSEP
ncbi:MAG: prolipoprotein diacylglyceryl transferase [Polyangia bacterium]|jgi:phosphatidylglycerol:prolipoprotein diacylglycerol transferase|nr:prolipoprotein diacylglyceryl transferase [Polyangia bacterium]